MRLIILLYIIFNTSIGYSKLQSDLGEDFYDKGQYQEASAAFLEALVAGERPRHAILYNLGNSYYMQGDHARSLASYLAARKLSPSNPEILANLKKPLANISDKVTADYPLPAWAVVFDFFRQFSPSIWWFISSLAFLLSAVMFYMHLKKNNRDYLYGMFGFLLVAAVVFSGYLYSSSLLVDWATVKEDNVTVYSGTSELSSKLFTLNQASPVVSERQHKGWVKVMISTGEKGWVQEDKLIEFNQLGVEK